MASALPPAALPPAVTSVERAASLRGPLLATLAILLLFFGLFGAWAAIAPLSGAAVAPGVVAPEGYRRTVQHLEGGIVSEIRVRDGSEVAAGDVLAVLDGAQSRESLAAAQARLVATLARGARLEAEQTGAAQAEFPKELLALADQDPATAALVQAEQQALLVRRQALADRVAVLTSKIAQARTDLVSHEGSLVAIDRQLALLDEETATVEDLVRKGLDRKPRLLALQRTRAELDGQRVTTTGNAARTRELIVATQAELAAQTSAHAEEVATGLAETRAKAGELRAEVRSARERLDRTVVRAPTAGTVVELQLRTIGGVVKPGDRILDIVPKGDPLVIEARVSPSDIDVVHAGLTADVRLLAYRSRHLPRITGEVRKVSADRLSDAKTGQPYYTAEIVVDPDRLHTLAPEVALTAGMPAEVLIITGERTMLDYLLDPLYQTFRRALRES
ncbi:MAG: HlyD family type I secretion periplasmic adaptor subunit [Geminicoccaceae bacterium]